MKINKPSDPEAIGLACQYINGEWHAYNPRHLPVLITSIDYWPAAETDNGVGELFMLTHYKPGRWLEVGHWYNA